MWDINNEIIKHIKTLHHNDIVYQVIPLTKDIIASAGSWDKPIKIWNVKEYKEELPPLRENFSVFSLLKLKNKNGIIAGGDGKSVSFWNTKTFRKEHIVKCCNCCSLLELPNNCVAVSSGGSSSIDVI